jgi:hypothetical protein
MAQYIFPVVARYVCAHNKCFSQFVKSLLGNSFTIKRKLHSSLSPFHEVTSLWIGQLLLGICLVSFS